MADLGHWLTGGYRVPVATPNPDDTLDGEGAIRDIDIEEEDTLQ
jgi:endogenous inhibitor of DNA gyrase (YacG/DUF329 family)